MEILTTDDLYKLSVEYKFSDAEIESIQAQHPKEGFRALYGFWKQHRRNGLYIWFALDQMPSSPRRSPFLMSSHVLGYRELTAIEHFEIAGNYGIWNRRFKVWHYRNLDGLKADDMKYGIETPTRIINQYKKLL